MKLRAWVESTINNSEVGKRFPAGTEIAEKGSSMKGTVVSKKNTSGDPRTPTRPHETHGDYGLKESRGGESKQNESRWVAQKHPAQKKAH